MYDRGNKVEVQVLNDLHYLKKGKKCRNIHELLIL